jgi:hypothetical protein
MNLSLKLNGRLHRFDVDPDCRSFLCTAPHVVEIARVRDGVLRVGHPAADCLASMKPRSGDRGNITWDGKKKLTAPKEAVGCIIWVDQDDKTKILIRLIAQRGAGWRGLRSSPWP